MLMLFTIDAQGNLHIDLTRSTELILVVIHGPLSRSREPRLGGEQVQSTDRRRCISGTDIVARGVTEHSICWVCSPEQP